MFPQREELAFRFDRAVRMSKSLNQHVLFVGERLAGDEELPKKQGGKIRRTRSEIRLRVSVRSRRYVSLPPKTRENRWLMARRGAAASSMRLDRDDTWSGWPDVASNAPN